MAINIDSLRSAFNTLDTNLHNNLFEIINSSKDILKSKIREKINEQFNIRKDLIDSLVTDSLLHPLEFFQNSLADLIIDKVDTVTKIVSRASEEISDTKASSELAVLVGEIVRDYRGDSLESIKRDFLLALPTFLRQYGSNDFLNLEVDEIKVEEVYDEVRKYVNQSLEKYINQNKDAIKTLTTEYRESLTFDKKVELTPEDIKNRVFVGTMSNYRLKTVDGVIAFVNQLTNEVYPTTKRNVNTFVSLDGSLEYSYDDMLWSFREGNKVITESNAFVAVGTQENPYTMQINFGFDTVEFLYNGNIIEDAEVIKFICEDFKSKAPVLYEKQLSKNPAITESYERACKESLDNEKFVVDENGVAHINNNNKSVLDSYLEAIGYKVEDRPDGVYLTNSLGLAQKARISGSNITLPDSTRIVVDLYRFLEKGTIQGPEIYYSSPNKDITAYINTDFTKISVFFGRDLYSLRINNGAIEARASIGPNKISDVDLIIGKIGEVIPGAISKMQELANSIVVQEVKEEQILDASFLNDDYYEEGLTEYDALLAEVEATPEEVFAEANEYDVDMSLEQTDDRLFELSQDPRVQEYLDLIKKAESLSNIQPTDQSDLGPIL